MLLDQMDAERPDELRRETPALGNIPAKLRGVHAFNRGKVLVGGEVVPHRQPHHAEEDNGRGERARAAANRQFVYRVLQPHESEVLQLIFVQLAMQRAPAHANALGGVGAVAVRLL